MWRWKRRSNLRDEDSNSIRAINREQWMNNKRKDQFTDIIAYNINGFPSNKANRRKLYELNKLAVNSDIMLFIETGINKNNKPKRICDDHELTRINH